MTYADEVLDREADAPGQFPQVWVLDAINKATAESRCDDPRCDYTINLDDPELRYLQAWCSGYCVDPIEVHDG